MIHGLSHARDVDKYLDRTVQEWHMRSFGADCKAIDMDLGGYCGTCYAWLYIIEAAETWDKPTSCVCRLSMQTGAVGLLIVHNEGRVEKGRRVYPKPDSRWIPESDLRRYIERMRRVHREVGHW